MTLYSTNEAAARLGISGKALSRYIQNGKVPAPKIIETGKASLHVWTEQEIETVRKLLPKIANGRKTRWQRERKKKNKTQPRAAVPHESRQRKQKRTKKKRPRPPD